MLRLMLLAGVGAAGILGAGSALASTVYNYSFENSNVPAGGFYYSPAYADAHSNGNAVAVPGVTFSGDSGVQSNGSAWGFAPAPDGTCTAFIQAYSSDTPGEIGLDVSNLKSGGHYDLSFYIAERGNYPIEPLDVTLGSDDLGTFNATSDSWTLETVSFTGNGATTLDFTGLGPSGFDYDVGLDDVTVTATAPETSTWVMMLAGLAGLGFMGTRQRRGAISAVD